MLILLLLRSPPTSGLFLWGCVLFKVEFDVKALSARFSDIEKRQIPFALANALNDTAFDVRTGWARQIDTVFDRPVPLTRNAVLFTKATKQNLNKAEIFIRDQASAGTPPVKYLSPEEHGGARRQKGFERKLGGSRAVLNPGQFYVPGSLPLDVHGNLPTRLYNKIFSQLGASEERTNETVKTRGRRLRRQRRKGGGGSYFVLKRNRGKLRAGNVYERIETGFGSSVRAVLFAVNRAPRYRQRFGARDLAARIAANVFPANFARRMRQAIATAR